MLPYLTKQAVKKTMPKPNKKIMMYSGAAVAGVGLYFSYKAIKKYNENKYMENEEYLDEYNNYDYENYANFAYGEEQYGQDDDLKAKVEEFNSRRINHENDNASPEEIRSTLEAIKEDKEGINLNPNDYKEEQYEKYDFYEEDKTKQH